MKRRLICVAGLLLTGCIVQSLQPFHTEQNKVEVPELTGKWRLVTAWGEDADAGLPPWEFDGDEIVTWDRETNSATIGVTYFKIGELLFADTTAKATKNWYAAWHTRPVNTVTLVKLTGDTVEFRPLDYEWFTNRVGNAFPHVTVDKFPLYTCSTGDWEKFLTTHGGDTNAFPATHRYVLKKQ